MAQYDYTSLTVGNATAGNAILASDHAVAFQNVNDLISPPSCGLYNTGNVSIANGGFQRLSFDTAAWDTDSMKASGTVTGISINTTGLYLVSIYALFDASANPLRGIYIVSGTSGTFGSNTTLAGVNATSPGNANYADVHTSVVASLTAGDTVQAFAFQYGASPGTATNVLGAANRIFSATWIGQV